MLLISRPFCLINLEELQVETTGASSPKLATATRISRHLSPAQQITAVVTNSTHTVRYTHSSCLVKLGQALRQSAHP